MGKLLRSTWLGALAAFHLSLQHLWSLFLARKYNHHRGHAAQLGSPSPLRNLNAYYAHQITDRSMLFVLECRKCLTAFFVAQPLEFIFLKMLRQCMALEGVGIYILYIRRRLGRIVKLAHQIVVRTGVRDTDVPDAASDVGLNHPIHFRIGDEVHQAIDVLLQSAQCNLRSANVIHRIELLIIERVFPKFLEHGEKGDVAQMIKLHVLAQILNLIFFPHLLGAGIIRFGALFTSQPAVELSPSRKLNLKKSLKLVDIVIGKHVLLLDQLKHFIRHVLIKVPNCLVQKYEFLSSKLCE